MPQSVEDLFRAAAILTGPSGSSDARSTHLKDVLRRRIIEYNEAVGKTALTDEMTLETLQSYTALEALSLLESLHEKLKAPDAPLPQEGTPTPGPRQVDALQHEQPLLGTRDINLISTLLSILFNWAVAPLLQRIVAAIPSTSASQGIARASIIDLTGLPHEFSTLSSISSRLLALVLPAGPGSPISQSGVTAALLNRQLSDLLVPCIVIGWLPKSLASDTMPTADKVRPLVMHLLSRLPASHVISAAGLALSGASSSLPYVRKTCTFILSRQLLRPEGIRGLCESVFGDEDASGEDVALDKLEHVFRLLSTVPTGMKAQEYLNVVVPRMLLLLSLDERALPPAHRRSLAFSLSRMLVNEDNSETRQLVMGLVFTMLHDPILHGSGNISPTASLNTIQVLLTNTDPSPYLISALLTPIAPSLYSLHACLEQAKASDPLLRATIKSFLSTWGRLVNSEEVITTIWRIIHDEGGDWRVSLAGEISRVEDGQANEQPSLSLFTPQSLKEAEEAGDFDVDSNLLGLKPDPVRLVQFLKGLDRADVSSDLFVQLLEEYRDLRVQDDADPMKTLLYLQLVLQMQTQLSSSDTSGVLKKPEHILSFIKHALENPRQAEHPASTMKPTSNTGLRMEDLRIVPEEESDEFDEERDSDDEDEDGEQEHGPDDMTSTAVKLLLAVLDANPDLSARTAPVLNDIFSLLEPISKAPEEELRSLAREARMVMTARLASTSEPTGRKQRKTSTSDDAEDPQETYQKALKLLQDQLLPVRAHGLMLLRQLVSARKDASGALNEPSIDRALIPGILSIFMQSVQDDDSYMFLNAVQGLSAMVDGFGKEVLRNLVSVYSDGLDGLSASTMSQHDVDMRTRVGEALGQVIRRCGDALPSYASILIPPLFQVVRASHFPTVLRASAISLLAQCVNTNALAVLPYTVEFADAMIDLLQVESVPATQRKPTRSEPEPDVKAPHAASSVNAKFPPLRRAALHFLALLTQACTRHVFETGSAERLLLPPGLFRRAKTTLGYVAATDADDVVRVMARETVDALDQLAEAIVGL
ncbi:hypothetical protein TRAPUB_50 [Trametes pubescens]|uniref:RNA polymerase II assembly factor Rtp1 C-terminal domain-containing protein n=1 Tax=Trametes pubescens TaxID=154538 RepID=A0A1M2VN46_TRAPU|nr:hypothetical protein TRAPUB_50 [Trametes pubescens]